MALRYESVMIIIIVLKVHLICGQILNYIYKNILLYFWLDRQNTGYFIWLRDILLWFDYRFMVWSENNVQ